ncbi:hypothetical protein K461DRAFT_24203 [Myriangium duriaei CBS 260.36]|uniref:Integral membrane bound transporter domain-containing protein n=1 Tax=Myriangium duriaei CBS 260.36 TaxID=1168546 RepID=A0A9P4JEY2_9PEZI|nr:hypothetical protein K461DRAFT_24203 [Myriangium duriaei CBS 260.36]
MPPTPAVATENGDSLRHKSRKFENATLIIPRTGERVRRQITLPELGHQDEPQSVHTSDTTEHTPLWAERKWTRWNRVNSSIRRSQQLWRKAVDFSNSKHGRGIFKCSLAYLLGTCGTFVPFLSDWLGRSDGKHIVATVTVYFHASRTAGSMVEATICAFVAFLYAAFLSFSSMGVSILFGKWDMLVTGHIIVLVFFLGGGLGFVAWIKQRLGNPLVNVACSLTALASITVFVKEGSIQAAKFSEDKVVQVLKMVILGIACATLINLTVFPESARKKLNTDLSKTTGGLGDLLNAITRAFLNGSEAEMQSSLFATAIKEHKECLKVLKGDLSESKWEHFTLGHEKQHEIETELVKCLQKLSQCIGGLRSAALVQFDLIRTTKMKDSMILPGKLTRAPSFIMQNSLTEGVLTAEPEDFSALGLRIINEEPEDSAATSPAAKKSPNPSASRHTLAPADMFENFIFELGPSMKSLTRTLTLILEELPFDTLSSNKIAINENFHSSLHQAVELFKTARREALTALYKNKDMYKTQSLERLADYEEIAASCGHFSYALIDLADEIGNYLELLEDLKTEREVPIATRTFNWLKFWRTDRIKLTKDPENRLMNTTERSDEDGPNDNVPSVLQRRDTFVKLENTSRRPWTYRAFRMVQFLRRDDIRFAAKVGIGAALLATPAFIAETRPTFAHLRLEWGLVSYMVVCSMTIGAVNTTGLERFFGTFIGAALAVFAWLVSHAHAIPLAFIGWVISLFCFYIIVAMKKGPMGRFIFLTYNLSALYAYSLSVKDDDDDEDEMIGVDPEIWEIVLHRVVSVLIGCVWAIIVTRVIWPISARKKLKEGMAMLFLRMGLVWKRDPLALLMHPDRPRSKYMDIREESHLQTFLTSLDGLRSSAKSEFELKGPFPAKSYGLILERTQRMLDNFHSMNVVIMRNLRITQGEMDVLQYTQNERAALSARISHLFSVLASTLRMEYPLNDVLPNIEHSRDRLLAKVFEFRRSDGADVGDVDYELIYAYVLATGQLAKDITVIIRELEMLYGTLNEDDFRLE